MKIFKHEKELGLEEKIISQGSTSVILDAFSESANPKLNQAMAGVIADNPPTSDLMSVSAILVSTNWNKNDDIFTPKETWAARFTPYMKPANKGHLGREEVNVNLTFGVISGTRPLDKDFDPINSFAEQDDIPEYFHLLVNVFLWERYFPTLCEEIKTKIKNGNMFVSMECFYETFDYGLKPVNGHDIMIIERSDNSSWMSRHLRAYGGTGELEIDGQKYKIGRVLKEITFSGVGFVERPANTDSIIFKDYISFASDGDNFKISFSELQNNSVLFFRKGEKYLWQTK